MIDYTQSMLPSTDRLDAAGVLAASVAAVRSRRAAQVEDLLLVLAWADLHGEDPQAAPGAAPVSSGGDRLVELGGDGTPWVSELSVHELAIARETHSLATRATMADVLDLRHRLPRTWAAVLELGCEPWVACSVARKSRALDREQVALVDAAVADAIGGTTPGRVLSLAEAKVIEADTPAHLARLEAERRRRGVWAGRTDVEAGNRTLVARLEPSDVTWVDGTLERVVDALLARPDILRAHHPDLPADLDDLTRQELRAIAFGWLARPDDLRELFAAAADPTVDVPRRPDRTGQRVVVHLHLHESALATVAGGVAQAESIGPLLLEQVTRLVGHAQVTVKPVLDLDEHVRVDAYEFPTAVSERTRLRCGGDVFPHATNTATMSGRFDDDHPVPYDYGGPPGQTGDHNNAPLTRTHHRAKTHLGYLVTQVDDGTYLWTTPHGLARLVDPTGTHAVDDDDAWRLAHQEDLHAALDRLFPAA